MSIASEIQRLKTSKANIKAQVNIDVDDINEGTDFIDDETLDDYADLIEDMQDAYKQYIPIHTKMIAKGNTSQNGTPTPTTPIEVKTVTGKQTITISNGTDSKDYEINLTSRNLLDYTQFTTRTEHGVTITNNGDGTFLVNGTATADISLAINVEAFVPMSGTWRMTGCPSGGSSSTYMLSAYVNYWGSSSPNIDIGSGTSITYTGNVKVRFYIKSGTTCNNLLFKPMLTYDTSASYDNFSPYYEPIELCKIGTYQDFIRKGTGKNLFDLENAYHGSINASGVVGSNESYRTTLYIPTKPNTNYYFSTTQKSGQTSKQIYIAYYDSTQTFISRTSYNLYESAFTTPSNCYYMRAGVYSAGQENIMLESGNTKTLYEPYGYKDKWYIEKNIGKVVLNGSENWSSGGTNTTGYIRFTTSTISTLVKTPSANSNIADILCNNYVPISADASYQRTQGMAINTSGIIQIYDDTFSTQTTADFKTWLQSNNTKVYYVLANPTYTLIDNEELIEQLEAVQLQTGENNVLVSGDLPMILDLSKYIQIAENHL